MFESLKAKILEYVDYPADEITEATEIVNDLGINSLDMASMIADLEDEFDISVEQDDLRDVVTLGDLMSVLHKQSEVG